jgi:hypothetical protein
MTQRSNYFTVSAFNNGSHFLSIDFSRILPSFLLSLSAHILHTLSTLSEKAADTADSEIDHQVKG